MPLEEIKHGDHRRSVLWSIFTLVGVFVADCATPIGIPVYVGYFIPIYFAVHSRKRFGVLIAAAGSLLTILGLYASHGPPLVTFGVALMNRLFVIAALWGATFVQMYRSSLELVRRRFALVAENARDIAIITVSASGEILDWNKGAENLFGWSESETKGRNMELFFTPEDRAAGVPAAERSEARRTGRGMDDRWQVRKDGNRFWANGVILPLDTSEETNFVKIIRDMTERRRMIDELDRQLNDLQRSNRDLEQFSYVAAHDLKAPLRTIANYGDLVRSAIEKGDAEKIRRYLELMDAGVARMRGLIDDLLAFARAGGAQLRIGPVSLTEVMDEVRQNLRSSIRENAAILRWEDLPVIFADRSQMVQLLQNLVANAVKYRSDEPPVINVSAGNAADGWRIDVQDNGAGIAAEEQERIFEPFHIGKQTKGGSGIGLAICRRIAERHGGRISVTSQAGKGSVFTIVLPRDKGPVSTN